MRDYIIVAAIAYLCGSIPFGYLLVRIFKKQDIRKTGSGNIGATNVARTAPELGLLTLALDAAKGFLPLAYILFPLAWAPKDLSLVVAIAAVSTVLGHAFPIWLKFRGGKGVATAVGVFLAVAPRSVAITLVIFLLVLAFSRYVSLGSIVGAVTLPILAIAFDFKHAPSPHFPLVIASIIISILVILKHHANIRRLLNGTENKFGQKKIQAVAAED